jgi:hypothetical protein
MDVDKEQLSLVYVSFIGENGDGLYEYDLYFSETPDIVWGENWAEQCPAAIGNIPPDESNISLIKRMVSPYYITCAQNNHCFSFQDCIDGIIKLCYIEVSDEFILKIDFGESYSDVVTKFKKIGVEISNE